MRIYLVQHGEAVDKQKDAARPLSAQGREDVTRVAGFLGLFEKPKPHLILHSGKLRAEQTAAMYSEAWGNIPRRRDEGLLPVADPVATAIYLEALQEDTMLVGHLPHLQQLVGLLLGGDSQLQLVRFRCGGVLCLERHEAGWMVLWHINPTLFYRISTYASNEKNHGYPSSWGDERQCNS